MKIIVNGKTHELNSNPGQPFYTISYETIVELAGYRPHRVLTVTYAHADRSGILIPCQRCVVEEGQIFNVADTSNS